MTPLLFTCAWLLIPSSLLLTLSTGELEIYQDGVPENSKDLALMQLARYIVEQGYQPHGYQRAHLSSLMGNPARKKHHLEFGKQKERDLLDLANKANLADILAKERLRGWNYHKQIQYNDPLNDLASERDLEPPYYDLAPLNKPFDYPSLKLPYFAHKPSRETAEEFDRPLLPGHQDGDAESRPSSFRGVDLERGMKEEEAPMIEFHGSYREPDHPSIPKDEETKPYEREFLSRISVADYRFDDANLSEERPFAVRPNDPRYYQDSFSFSKTEKPKLAEEDEKDTDEGKTDEVAENEETVRNDHQNLGNGKYGEFKDGFEVALPVPDEQTEHQPVAVPVNRDLNNDIYFIAIVAGCSAAAMFVLVLISLTWCRLQRGVKAAADIEYPAYGVTGPNKDVSPSGDQRLAQSAQMYHFQHQKQQIIAMENNASYSRTSATRDPGSVSEAESDEENEEGDYTVYECPGLAPTSEMEVKNPLFHDDPTPATPAHTTNKEEDHI